MREEQPVKNALSWHRRQKCSLKMFSRLHIKAFWRKKILDCVDFKCFCCTQAILTHKKNKTLTDLYAAHLFLQTLTRGNELELIQSRFFSSMFYMCSWSLVCFVRLACLKQHIVVDYESSCICSVASCLNNSEL